MWEWIYLLLVLGPGAYLLGRWQFFEKEPSQNALILTLLWTYAMLFIQFVNRSELSDDHIAICEKLETFLRAKDPDGMEHDYSATIPFECYKYSQEYADGAADYYADK